VKYIILLFICSGVFSQTIDYTVKFVYLKPDRELLSKLDAFSLSLEKQLDTYNWKFPHDDFAKIETSISINIEKSVSGKEFTGVITVSSGITSDVITPIALKKDIYYNEQNATFRIEYEREPDITDLNSSSVESVIMFYAYLTLGEIFDRLSYTDQKNFRLEGDIYYQKLYEFENQLASAADRTEWNKRLEIINAFRTNGNMDFRRLNAYVYNAVYFFNKGLKERAALFAKPIMDSMSGLDDIPDFYFMNNFMALGEICGLSEDSKAIEVLIKKDPAHESYYLSKMPEKTDQPEKPERKPHNPQDKK